MTTRHSLLLARSSLFLCSGFTNHNLAYLILGLRKGNDWSLSYQVVLERDMLLYFMVLVLVRRLRSRLISLSDRLRP
jgi:hypothetical protein